MTNDGRRYWRSLDELADTPAFREMLHREFPENASEWEDPVGRRAFLKLMGASLALAGVTGCTRQPKEEIWPYTKAPEEMVPGKPRYFATALPLQGYAQGVLVESHMGRPTKVEGNPDHPSSLGACDAWAQAAILGLYDPDRSKAVLHLGEIQTWADVVTAVQSAVESLEPFEGEGLRILTETVTSPTLADHLRKVLERFPRARWHQYEPAARDHVLGGAVMAFGEPLSTRYRFDRADVVLALDADFVAAMPGSVRYVRDFVGRRRASAAGGTPVRLYAAEPTPSLTGAMADHRLPIRARDVETLARAVASELRVVSADAPVPLEDEVRRWAAAVARDLAAHPGASLVVAGDTQPPAVHALAHAMNHALGNAGKTVVHSSPVEAEPVDEARSLRELTDDMKAGRVTLLLILEANPVYAAPADLGFADAMQKVALRMHVGPYDDETAALCHWHAPGAHPLESWGDARAFDGSVTILQPLVEPLYDGKTAIEMLAAFHGQAGRSAHDLVREAWNSRWAATLDAESRWRRTLRDGMVEDTTLAHRPLELLPLPPPSAAPDDTLEIVFRLDPCVHDGRFANNGWLQELPKPLTKITWDNAALVAPATAKRYDLENEQIVELEIGGRSVSAPVWIQPGQADGSVTVHLGAGRERAGRVGNGVGFNAFALRTSDAPWFAPVSRSAGQAAPTAWPGRRNTTAWRVGASYGRRPWRSSEPGPTSPTREATGTVRPRACTRPTPTPVTRGAWRST